jgi:predicted dehydrogenase
VRTVIADHSQDLPKDPKGRLQNPDLGGGALLDLGIYPVSFADDIFGEPTRILADAAFTPTGVDRQDAITLSYADGQQALLSCALDSPGPNRAAVLGTAGHIDIDATWYTPTSFTVYDATGAVVERFVSDEKLRGMQYQAFEAERLIRAGLIESPLLTSADTVRIMGVLDAVRAQIGLRYPGE